MDIAQLKEKLCDNEESIRTILEEAGFVNIHKSNNGFRCAFEEGGNDSSVSVNSSTLKSIVFSRNIQGDIITLIQKKLNLEFIDAFKWICAKLGYSTSYKKKDIILPFGGAWKRFSKDTYVEEEYTTYDESILDGFGKGANHLFIKDGISIQAQERYECLYDVASNRFCVVWRDMFGKIIGITGRYNGDWKKDGVAKWFPIIPFTKGTHLFGLNLNYNSIVSNEVVIILESEKAPMQLSSWGLDVGVGLGGNVVTDQRANIIKALRPKTIIVALDEGLDVDISRKNAELLKSDNSLYKNKVCYIHDKNNKYLAKDSKNSPTDIGYEGFKKILNDEDCVVWV